MKSTRILTLTALIASTIALPLARAEKPAPAGDIVAVAVGAGSFNTLVAAVKAAGLVETLQGAGPFTVFAPTDAAFAKLPKGTVEDLLKPENKEKLIAILTYHVVPGKVMAADVKTMKAKTVNGQELTIVLNHIGVEVDDLDLTEARVSAAGLRPFSHGDYEPGRRFYFLDPDGIEYEIVSYATPANLKMPVSAEDGLTDS